LVLEALPEPDFDTITSGGGEIVGIGITSTVAKRWRERSVPHCTPLPSMGGPGGKPRTLGCNAEDQEKKPHS
jgi:hypothetical protein